MRHGICVKQAVRPSAERHFRHSYVLDASYFVVVDGMGGGDGEVLECDESNNSASTVSAECPMPG